jgi:hypothetical protein
MTDEPAFDALLAYAREVVGGPYCGGADEGRALGDFLVPLWPRYRKIRLSFRGVDVVEFPFCLALARTLARALGAQAAAAKLDITALDARGQCLLAKALAFAALPPDADPEAE